MCIYICKKYQITLLGQDCADAQRVGQDHHQCNLSGENVSAHHLSLSVIALTAAKLILSLTYTHYW